MSLAEEEVEEEAEEEVEEEVDEVEEEGIWEQVTHEAVAAIFTGRTQRPK